MTLVENQNIKLLLQDPEVQLIIGDILENIPNYKFLKPVIHRAILENKALVRHVLGLSGEFLFALPEEYTSDKDMVKIATKNYPGAIDAASSNIKSSFDFIYDVFQQAIINNNHAGFDFYFNLPQDIKTNISIAKIVLSKANHPFSKYPLEIQTNKECIEIALNISAWNVIHIDSNYLNDDLLLKHIHKKPELVIARCSEKVKKDRNLVLSLFEKNTSFFQKVYEYYNKDKVVIIKYIAHAGMGAIKDFPILKSNKKAIRYLIFKGLSTKSSSFFRNWNDFVDFIEYEEMKDALSYFISLYGEGCLDKAFQEAVKLESSRVTAECLSRVMEKKLSTVIVTEDINYDYKL